MSLGIGQYDGMILPQNTSSASNVHEARIALGGRLRELREHAGLQAKELAETLRWHPTKISKMENGKQTPVDGEIVAWTRATNSEAEAANLLASLHTLKIQYAEWRRIMRAGVRPRQNELAERDQKTRLFRVFESTVVPGLLQTSEYARARIAEAIRTFGLTSDVNEAVEGRMKRQDVFYRPGKRLHFVVTEAALRLRLCPPEIMLGQLDRLISLSALPNVRLGIIGLKTAYTVAPWHGFWIYDDDAVLVETYSAGLNLTQPQEIELYGRVFDELAAVAVYGRTARTIITEVIDDLAVELDDDDS
jgi:transcriptional regulator with XRE-family HTH domain